MQPDTKSTESVSYFDGIIGQDVPTDVLTHLFKSSRLPGTFLFHGPGGVGKLATALTLARALHCKSGSFNNCDCDSCRAIRTGSHPDVIVLSREKQIGVDEIRELVALAGLRSTVGQERVIIIDRAEYITTAAGNAALKTLEEPGDHVRFILITDTPARLLSTVRSRSYHLRFSLLTGAEMIRFTESVGDSANETSTRDALEFANGRPGLYLRWKHSQEYRDVVNDLKTWLKQLPTGKRTASIESALKWKKAFWEFAELLSSAERAANLPRGGDAFEIRRYYESQSEYPVNPVNWRVEERAGKDRRWSQGRKALLLAGNLRRVLSLDLDTGKARAITRLQDFMEKIRFNCSFDITLERLYFSLAGLKG